MSKKTLLEELHSNDGPPPHPIQWAVTYTITVALPGKFQTYYQARDAARRYVRRHAPRAALYGAEVEPLSKVLQSGRMVESGDSLPSNPGSTGTSEKKPSSDG